MTVVSHHQNTGLYVCLVVYMLGVIAMGVVARKVKRRAAPVAGPLRGHFGGSFGNCLLFLTVFASVFSGYAVTGVPMEAQTKGFLVVRWMMGVTSCGLGMLIFYPRLRRLSVERQYLSPNDFITDRYGSPKLRLLCSVVACVPQLLNLTVQFVSFSDMIEGFTLGAVPGPAAMALLAALVLIMEQMGGIHSVVLTDAVQGLVMIVGFAALPVVLAFHYGTLQDLSPAGCSTLGYVNKTSLVLLKAAGDVDAVPEQCGPGAARSAECEPFGCVMDAHPEFFTYPTRSEQMAFFCFVFNLMAFPLNPHMVQRVYSASSDSTLKHVVIALMLSVFLVNPPGIMAGLVVATFGRSWSFCSQDGGTFASVGNELMTKGCLEYMLVAVLTCGAVAALMSTADSVVLGVSNTLAIDFYNDWKQPEASPEQVVKFGGIVSALMLLAACVWGNFIGASQFGSILTWQTGLLLQLVPAYLLGLYTNIATRAVSAGLMSGVVVFALTAIWNPLEQWHVPAPDIGAVANWTVLVGVCIWAPGDACREASSKFGEPLTLSAIRATMATTREPCWIVLVSMLALIILATPIYGVPGEMDSVTWGLPTWACLVVTLTVVGVLLGVIAALSWQPHRGLYTPNPSEDLSGGSGRQASDLSGGSGLPAPDGSPAAAAAAAGSAQGSGPEPIILGEAVGLEVGGLGRGGGAGAPLPSSAL